MTEEAIWHIFILWGNKKKMESGKLPITEAVKQMQWMNNISTFETPFKNGKTECNTLVLERLSPWLHSIILQ